MGLFVRISLQNFIHRKDARSVQARRFQPSRVSVVMYALFYTGFEHYYFFNFLNAIQNVHREKKFANLIEY